ncbi:MAG: RNA-guided endonuclease InsQ/TnpB family protein [Promethearchaeota archaeon]
MTLSKAATIKATRTATKERRRHQTCRVYLVKLCYSHLSQETRHHLQRLFLEAKWLYNHLIDQPDLFAFDYKIKAVPVKVKGKFETRPLRHLSSQMKQALLDRVRANIRGLARRKAKGHQVGALKFKKRVRSIPLKQYGNTYTLLNKKYVRVQGIRQKLRVNGLAQLPDGVELANGVLLERHGDYYLAITTFQPEGPVSLPPFRSVGIDFGVATPLTLSVGIAIRYTVPISLNRRLRRLHQKLSRQTRWSRNWWKTRRQLEKAYARLSAIKRDIRNKLVHFLRIRFRVVCYQAENLRGWQRRWGATLLASALGGIIRAIDARVHTPVRVDRWFPSTKTCSGCGAICEVRLEERVYSCSVCGLVMDRDQNASLNIEAKGLKDVGMGRTDLKPVETGAATRAWVNALSRIPYVRASPVCEAGSLTVSA